MAYDIGCVMRLQEGKAMAIQLLLGLIRLLMLSAPFLSMLLMILALWGVIGKTTYIDLETAKPNVELGAGEAKNYMVNEIKVNEQCPDELKNPDIVQEAENPKPAKIDWERVV
jgi:hypothetical protein